MARPNQPTGRRILVSWGVPNRLKGSKASKATGAKDPLTSYIFESVAKKLGLKEYKPKTSTSQVVKDKKGRRILKGGLVKVTGSKKILLQATDGVWHQITVPANCSLAMVKGVVATGNKIAAIKFPNGETRAASNAKVTKKKKPAAKTK